MLGRSWPTRRSCGCESRTRWSPLRRGSDSFWVTQDRERWRRSRSCGRDRDLLPSFPRGFLFGSSRLPSAWRSAGRGIGRDSVFGVASSVQAEGKRRMVGGDG